MFKRIIPFVLLIVFLSTNAFADRPKIKLVTTPYACAITSTNLAAAVLDRAGYDAEITMVSVATMWKALEIGEADASVGAWLPQTHGTYYAEVKDKVENYGANTKGARLGWVVPKYVTIDSITELNANKDKFGNEIVGIAPSAGLMLLSETAIKEYDLDLELKESSGAAMTAMLGDAIRQKKWIVVTGWSPHWKFGRWELKYLEDPKGILGGPEEIVTIVRKGFSKDYPEAAAILDRIYWDIDVMQTEMFKNEEEGAVPLKNANVFLDNHPELLKKWLGK
ncbi:glycine betaine/proline transport system substrate-binding protein [Maridesulfovibrio ferrireducens]|uniref:Glycine betaine/proline transport system substrate-binding protein n=1 Tax=Maridesulfovibrio ferrireducens TaxID=246191 RepID=A0A1G9FY00_9BACT|nr:glycine betaine ABC transporter substrate-binding protein [Maridesulfovibrio ferrireducens]SDK93232.1 glycine betaine/proline transport system substrate-binding protein [Maridesulfovibrio ferrireducens]